MDIMIYRSQCQVGGEHLAGFLANQSVYVTVESLGSASSPQARKTSLKSNHAHFAAIFLYLFRKLLPFIIFTKDLICTYLHGCCHFCWPFFRQRRTKRRKVRTSTVQRRPFRSAKPQTLWVKCRTEGSHKIRNQSKMVKLFFETELANWPAAIPQ